MKKKIVALTGIRSEYDIIYPLLKALHKDAEFELSVIACGAHLSERFGLTVREIEKDGFLIAERIPNLIDSDQEIGKAKSAALLAVGLSDALDRLKPDYVLVAGDREEPLVAGLVSTYLGIPLIHLCGGDRTEPKAGDVDEPIRHAASKLACLHFTMNEEHKQRLLKMGEEPWRVFNFGNPALDRFAEIEKMEKKQLRNYFNFDEGDPNRPLLLVLQHVISGEVLQAQEQMAATLEAVTRLDADCVINYPNSDMGSRALVQVIERYRALPNVRITKNIPRKEFVNLLRNVDLVVGNSSLAILEGCFLKIPAINVGERNKNRMNGGNVVFVPETAAAIHETAHQILTDAKRSDQLRNCRPIYGDGQAAPKIVDALKRLKQTKAELLAKKITY